jgi:hypothetical protein
MTSKYLTLAAVALAAAVLPAQAATISLIAPSSVLAGSSFDVIVQITGVFDSYPTDAVSSFGFNVDAGDPALVTYTGATAGGLFDDYSWLFAGSPQVVGIPSAGYLEASGFIEPLILATLHFEALAQGVTTIGITTDVSNLSTNQGLYYSDAGNVSLDATTSVNVTPEPGTVLLGGLALAALSLFHRQRRHSTPIVP